MAFKDRHFGQFRTINARYISCYLRVSGDLIRRRNRSKLVERSCFSLTDFFQVAKFILLFSIWRVGDDFHKKNLKFKNFFFSLFYHI